MAPRWPLEAHFELFWALVAEWLRDGLWGRTLSCSWVWWQNDSQMVAGGSFWGVLGSGNRMAPRWPLEADFELFGALVTE